MERRLNCQQKEKKRRKKTSLRASKATIQNNFKKCLEKTTGWKEGHVSQAVGVVGQWVYEGQHTKHQRRQWHPTPVLLPEKILWMEEPGRLQSMGLLRVGTTERLHFHFSLSCIGEGNGNPLQCSCLENPRDGGA